MFLFCTIFFLFLTIRVLYFFISDLMGATYQYTLTEIPETFRIYVRIFSKESSF